MKVREFDQGIILQNIENFHPVDTFECGQCFRWNKVEEDTYIGVVQDKVIEVALRGRDLYIYNITLEDFYDRWMGYFDLKRNYTDIQETLKTDEILKRAIPHGKGIRLLKQDPWETLISFIISANKNIPHIKIIIEKLCKSYGRPLEYKGKIYHSFPSPKDLENLTIEDIVQTKCGYRAKFIHSAIERANKGEMDLYGLENLPIQQARKQLLILYGVGPKIADCILLFSMGKYAAFPTDVWVKRVMEYFYFQEETSMKKIQSYANEKWGELAGFAQQYLFHYARNIENLGKANRK